MPAYVAFLRAINLGAKRKFPKAEIKAAVEAAGGTDVETYINTGNVRFDSTLRSRAKVETVLEDAFLADRGFEVPTIVFTRRELVEIADQAEELTAAHPKAVAHYVTLYKSAPAASAAAAVHALAVDGEVCHVDGRSAHVVLLKNFHQSRLLNGKPFAALGIGTARNVTVIRALADKWGG